MTAGNRILIVDPFKNLLDIYRMFFEMEKYSVHTALTLKEAPEKLSQDHYGVLITEFLPPFEETFRSLQQIRERWPETYIIILTGALVSEETYEKLFDIPVDDLIFKPYSLGKILVHVKKGFRNRSFILKIGELERESLVDPITSQVQRPIFNLNHFRRCLRQELKRAKRHKRIFSLILTEVIGDIMPNSSLESFTIEFLRVLRDNTRQEDIVGRGNESFGILLPETDEAGSQALINRLLRLIRSHHLLRTEADSKSVDDVLSLQTFTYPEKFILPRAIGVDIRRIVGSPIPHT